MRKTKSILFVLLLLIAFSVRAGVVDTIKVYSPSMKKDIQVVVVIPEKSKTPVPVVYLLHGHGGNAKTWVTIRPDLPQLADQYGIMFVCPDGNRNSWYWDSPKDPSLRYETFISGELIKYIDSHYSTIEDRSARAITGLSMGGHGAMWLSLRHKDVFGAAGSTSGGLDIRPFPNNWEMAEKLGTESENREIWEAHTAINQIDRLRSGDLALIFDCGYDDFFFEVNNDFHKKLLKYKIGHDFIVRPGGHTNEYWKNAIGYQILFFKNFFDRNRKK